MNSLREWLESEESKKLHHAFLENMDRLHKKVEFKKVFEYSGGNCPYQAGIRFWQKGQSQYWGYFRAWGSDIRLEVYSSKDAMNSLEDKDKLWEEHLTMDGEFAAGWINDQMANLLIDYFIVRFYKNDGKTNSKTTGV